MTIAQAKQVIDRSNPSRHPNLVAGLEGKRNVISDATITAQMRMKSAADSRPFNITKLDKDRVETFPTREGLSQMLEQVTTGRARACAPEILAQHILTKRVIQARNLIIGIDGPSDREKVHCKKPEYHNPKDQLGDICDFLDRHRPEALAKDGARSHEGMRLDEFQRASPQDRELLPVRLLSVDQVGGIQKKVQELMTAWADSVRIEKTYQAVIDEVRSHQEDFELVDTSLPDYVSFFEDPVQELQHHKAQRAAHQARKERGEPPATLSLPGSRLPPGSASLPPPPTPLPVTLIKLDEDQATIGRVFTEEAQDAQDQRFRAAVARGGLGGGIIFVQGVFQCDEALQHVQATQARNCFAEERGTPSDSILLVKDQDHAFMPPPPGCKEILLFGPDNINQPTDLDAYQVRGLRRLNLADIATANGLSPVSLTVMASLLGRDGDGGAYDVGLVDARTLLIRLEKDIGLAQTEALEAQMAGVSLPGLLLGDLGSEAESHYPALLSVCQKWFKAQEFILNPVDYQAILERVDLIEHHTDEFAVSLGRFQRVWSDSDSNLANATFLIKLVCGHYLHKEKFPLVVKFLSHSDKEAWKADTNSTRSIELVRDQVARLIRATSVMVSARQEPPPPGYIAPAFQSDRLITRQLPPKEYNGKGSARRIKSSELEDAISKFVTPTAPSPSRSRKISWKSHRFDKEHQPKPQPQASHHLSTVIAPPFPQKIPQELPQKGMGGGRPQKPASDVHQKLLRKENFQPDTIRAFKASQQEEDVEMEENHQGQAQGQVEPLTGSKSPTLFNIAQDESPLDIFKTGVSFGDRIVPAEIKKEKEETQTGLQTVLQGLATGQFTTKKFHLNSSPILRSFAREIMTGGASESLAITAPLGEGMSFVARQVERYVWENREEFDLFTKALHVAIGTDLDSSISLACTSLTTATFSTISSDPDSEQARAREQLSGGTVQQAAAWPLLQRIHPVPHLPIPPPLGDHFTEAAKLMAAHMQRMLAGRFQPRISNVVEATLSAHKELGPNSNHLISLLAPNHGRFKSKGVWKSLSKKKQYEMGLEMIVSLFLHLKQGGSFDKTNADFDKAQATRIAAERLVRDRTAAAANPNGDYDEEEEEDDDDEDEDDATTATGAEAGGDENESIGAGAEEDGMEFFEAAIAEDEASRQTAEEGKVRKQRFQTFKQSFPRLAKGKFTVSRDSIKRELGSFVKRGKQAVDPQSDSEATEDETLAFDLVAESLLELFLKVDAATSVRASTQNLTPLDLAELGPDSLDLSFVIILLEIQPSISDSFIFGKLNKFQRHLVPRVKNPIPVHFSLTSEGCQALEEPEKLVRNLKMVMENIIHSFAAIPAPPASLDDSGPPPAKRQRVAASRGPRSGTEKLNQDAFQASDLGQSEREKVRRKHEEHLDDHYLRQLESAKHLFSLSSRPNVILQDSKLWSTSPSSRLQEVVNLLTANRYLREQQKPLVSPADAIRKADLQTEIDANLGRISSMTVIINEEFLISCQKLNNRVKLAYVTWFFPKGTKAQDIPWTYLRWRITDQEGWLFVIYRLFPKLSRHFWPRQFSLHSAHVHWSQVDLCRVNAAEVTTMDGSKLKVEQLKAKKYFGRQTGRIFEMHAKNVGQLIHNRLLAADVKYTLSRRCAADFEPRFEQFESRINPLSNGPFWKPMDVYVSKSTSQSLPTTNARAEDLLEALRRDHPAFHQRLMENGLPEALSLLKGVVLVVQEIISKENGIRQESFGGARVPKSLSPKGILPDPDDSTLQRYREDFRQRPTNENGEVGAAIGQGALGNDPGLFDMVWSARIPYFDGDKDRTIRYASKTSFKPAKQLKIKSTRRIGQFGSEVAALNTVGSASSSFHSSVVSTHLPTQREKGKFHAEQERIRDLSIEHVRKTAQPKGKKPVLLGAGAGDFDGFKGGKNMPPRERSPIMNQLMRKHLHKFYLLWISEELTSQGLPRTDLDVLHEGQRLLAPDNHDDFIDCEILQDPENSEFYLIRPRLEWGETVSGTKVDKIISFSKQSYQNGQWVTIPDLDHRDAGSADLMLTHVFHLTDNRVFPHTGSYSFAKSEKFLLKVAGELLQ